MQRAARPLFLLNSTARGPVFSNTERTNETFCIISALGDFDLQNQQKGFEGFLKQQLARPNFSKIGQFTANPKCYLWISGTRSQKLTVVCQMLLAEFKLNRKLFLFDTAFFPGGTPIPFCPAPSPITGRTLRHISSPPPHKAVILWLSPQSAQHT